MCRLKAGASHLNLQSSLTKCTSEGRKRGLFDVILFFERVLYNIEKNS